MHSTAAVLEAGSLLTLPRPPSFTPSCCPCCFVQAFINTAREIYKKIQDGVFDVSNEVSRQALGAAVSMVSVSCEFIAVRGQMLWFAV